MKIRRFSTLLWLMLVLHRLVEMSSDVQTTNSNFFEDDNLVSLNITENNNHRTENGRIRDLELFLTRTLYDSVVLEDNNLKNYNNIRLHEINLEHRDIDTDGLQEPHQSSGVRDSNMQGATHGFDTLLESTKLKMDKARLQCFHDLMTYSSGLGDKKFWSLKMADATGRHGPGLLTGSSLMWGNSAECLQVQSPSPTENNTVIKGNYCLVKLSVSRFLFEPVKQRLNLEWYLCVPNSCNGEAITSFLHSLSLNISVSSTQCFTPKDISQDRGAMIAICIFIFMCLLAGVGCICEITLSSPTNTSDREHICHVNRQKENKAPGMSGSSENLTSIGVVEINERGLLHSLLLSFSIKRNVHFVLTTKTKKTDLSCIHGVRVLSMAWVILGHTVFILAQSSQVSNKRDIDTSMTWFPMQAVVNGFLAVDTFFLLSGCLVSYLFLRDKERRGGISCRQMLLYYIHRYLRLTPLYMAVILFYACLSGYVRDGVNQDFISDRDNCRYSWWTNMLYINNLYKNSYKDICLMQSWYLAADMQLHWIAPLVLLPLACGWAFIGFLIITALICIHVTTYTVFVFLYKGYNFGQTTHYMMPFCRVGVFAVGLGLGYILYKTKCKARIPKVLQILGWTLAIGGGLVCTYITYDHWSLDRQAWAHGSWVAYEVASKPAWALAVSWIILACCTGRGGIVNSLLSWKVWVPLGRLSYGAFLTHTIILTLVLTCTATPVYYSANTIAYLFLVTWLLSYGSAFLFSVLIELPFAGVERVLVRRYDSPKVTSQIL